MQKRPLILLSNDDGVAAPGLHSLREALLSIADVVIVAPEHEQSAHSHMITLTRPLRHREVEPNVHAIDGTPADCVYIGIFHKRLLGRLPDLVVSGMNFGVNLGSDVFYSGTVAAAREGALRGIPSIAFSLERGADFAKGAAISCALTARVIESLSSLPSTLLLNVNIPKGEPKGVRIVRLGRRIYEDEVAVRTDPRGREYFWIGGPGASHEPMENSDTEALDQGYVAITRLGIDLGMPDESGITGRLLDIEMPR